MRGNPGGAPAYDDTAYWEARFQRVARSDDDCPPTARTSSVLQDGVEWLGKGDVLLDAFRTSIKHREKGDSEEESFICIHLGAGVSDLGLRIAECMLSYGMPVSRLVNLDFSQAALHVGQKRMLAWAAAKGIHSDGPQFRLADLRHWSSLSGAFPSNLGASAAASAFVDCILDKSTSDSIATGEQIEVSTLLSDAHDTCPLLREQLLALDPSVESISPLDLVAFHLACMTRSNALWAALTFAHDRFDILRRECDRDQECRQGRRRTLSSAFWCIEDHQSISAPSGSDSPTAPTVSHHFFLLRRM